MRDPRQARGYLKKVSRVARGKGSLEMERALPEERKVQQEREWKCYLRRVAGKAGYTSVSLNLTIKTRRLKKFRCF